MLLGELNASHLTFVAKPSPQPWESPDSEFETTRHLGIRFGREDPGNALVVAEVIRDSPADTCSPPVKPGDTVISIDGLRVDASMPVHRFMNGRMDRKIALVVRDAGGTEHHHRLEPITYKRAAELADAARVSENRERIDALSEGRLGYIHINRMIWDEFEKFERQIYAAGHGKEGLIIDVRDNRGGFIADHLLTVLCQPRHAVTATREQKPGYPQHRKVYASWHKPLVVLCNQNSYSNAEIFAHAIKTLGRGKLVGVPTAGGVISANKKNILGIGTMRIPFRGWFLPDCGEDMEMNGARPDHLVWPEPGDLVAGRDAQLEKAVAALTEEVAAAPANRFRPRYRNHASD